MVFICTLLIFWQEVGKIYDANNIMIIIVMHYEGVFTAHNLIGRIFIQYNFIAFGPWTCSNNNGSAKIMCQNNLRCKNSLT